MYVRFQITYRYNEVDLIPHCRLFLNWNHVISSFAISRHQQIHSTHYVYCGTVYQRGKRQPINLLLNDFKPNKTANWQHLFAFICQITSECIKLNSLNYRSIYVHQKRNQIRSAWRMQSTNHSEKMWNGQKQKHFRWKWCETRIEWRKSRVC